MNAFSISLLVIFLLTLAGCGEKSVSSKTVAAVPAVTAKELAPKDKFDETKKKAEAGDAEAQVNLGILYANGEYVPEDTAKAMEWWQKAAEQGNAVGQAKLGWWTYIVSKDVVKALELLQQSAAQGEPSAQQWLGSIYSRDKIFVNGVLVNNKYKDASKAIELYLKAASQGNAQAANSLGYLYKEGKGVKKDTDKSFEWFRKAFELNQKAAEHGDKAAQKRLSEAYFYGNGITENNEKAIEWAEKAATQGTARDKFELGAVFFRSGIGVPKDAVRAFEWARQAAEEGYVDAYYTIGEMYSNGEGVPKNIEKAFEWYLKGAAQGDYASQYVISQMYANGEGVSRNLVIAYAWFNLASAKENRQIIQKSNRIERIELEKQLIPAQRAEGQRLASNWKKGDILQASSGDASGSASPDGKPSKQGTGTAFAVSSAGHALTNHHVVNGCTEVKVAGREGIAKVITSDSVNDLALLQLPGKVKDIASLNPEPGKLRQGEDIIVFGYPLNSVLSSGGNLTPGTLSALTGLGNNTNQIQITAPIQPGSSGSPVMDKKGDVVGVVVMKLSDSKMAKATGQIGQNVNFAINGQTARAFLDANQVPYKTGGGLFSREKSNADIAEEARKWTVLVECWK